MRLPGWLYGPLVLILAKADTGVRALGLSLLSVLVSGILLPLLVPNIISVSSLGSGMW